MSEPTPLAALYEQWQQMRLSSAVQIHDDTEAFVERLFAQAEAAPVETVRAIEQFIREDISGERLSELLGVNVAEVMEITGWINNAKARYEAAERDRKRDTAPGLRSLLATAEEENSALQARVAALEAGLTDLQGGAQLLLDQTSKATNAWGEMTMARIVPAVAVEALREMVKRARALLADTP
jgi:hypothetical protein